MINIAAIDEHLSQQGRFCLIDWLLANNVLFYADYEDWRYGRCGALDDALQLDREEIQRLLDDTERHCRDLGLISEPQDFYRWNDDQSMALTASANSRQSGQFTQRWLSAQDQPQMDLFIDNSAQMAENGLLAALGDRQFDTAQELLQRLSKLNPGCVRLGSYQDLINYGSHMQANPLIEADAVEAELQGLRREVLPLAQEVLGPTARDYLTFSWRRLAESMQSLTFNPAQPELHTSAALLEIPDYPATIDRLRADPSLYLQPVLLERLAVSYHALHQNDKALTTWCLMMEQDESYTEAAIERHKSHPIHQYWQDLWDTDDDWPPAHFPAFVLVKHPALIHSLSDFPSLKQPASQAMKKLLQMRLRGENEITARQNLQGINPKLLRIYLNQ